MKKFLGVLFIAGALTACNNSGDTSANPDSSGKDSNAMQTPLDTNNANRMGSDTNNRSGSGTGTGSDTNGHRTDSSNKSK
jgi:hypothetical protein